MEWVKYGQVLISIAYMLVSVILMLKDNPRAWDWFIVGLLFSVLYNQS